MYFPNHDINTCQTAFRLCKTRRPFGGPYFTFDPERIIQFKEGSDGEINQAPQKRRDRNLSLFEAVPHMCDPFIPGEHYAWSLSERGP